MVIYYPIYIQYLNLKIKFPKHQNTQLKYFDCLHLNKHVPAHWGTFAEMDTSLRVPRPY